MSWQGLSACTRSAHRARWDTFWPILLVLSSPLFGQENSTVRSEKAAVQPGTVKRDAHEAVEPLSVERFPVAAETAEGDQDREHPYEIVSRPHGTAVTSTKVKPLPRRRIPARDRRKPPRLLSTSQRQSAVPLDRVSSPEETRSASSSTVDPDRNRSAALAQWSYDLGPRTDSDATAAMNREAEDDEPRTLQQAIVEIRRAVDALLPGNASESEAEAAIPGNNADRSLRLATAQEPYPTDGILGPPDALERPSWELPATPGGLGNNESKTWLLTNELAQVAADVSRTVIQTPSAWELSSLRNRTRAIIDASETTEIREQAQQLLARIAQFDDLQRRYRKYEQRYAARQTTTGSRTLLSAKGGSPQPSADLPPVDVTQYDGYGWLMPVVTGNRSSPRYVLTDNAGNILQFVVPSPGLNLRPYERKRVGIFGQRGFLSSMRQPQLVAERVVTIDRLH